MFRKMGLKALYEAEEDQLSLWQRVVLTVVWNVCPVIVFIGSVWFFKTWVWTDPMTVVWK